MPPKVNEPGQDVPSIQAVLGPLGSETMRVLWEQGEATVSQVETALNADRTQPLAYTTVMTILVRLSRRGFVIREKRGRQFAYRPAAPEPELMETLSARAVDELLARYGESALRHFADRLADADPDLRAQLVALASRRTR